MKTAFYLSNLASSTAAMCLTASLCALLLKEGEPLWLIGLMLGSGRLATIGANTLFGWVSDSTRPARFLVVLETLACLVTFPIIWTWGKGSTGTTWLVVFFALRCALFSLGSGPRAKLSKYFSESDLASHRQEAARLNATIHGAALFAGLIGIYFVSVGSILLITAFVCAGSLISALSLLKLWEWNSGNLAIETDRNRFGSPQVFHQFAPREAKLDLLLAISMMGLGALNARLAGPSEFFIPAMLSLYGLAVWLAGSPFIRTSFLYRTARPSWIGLGASFLALVTLGYKFPLLILPLCFLRDFFYWTIYHQITASIHWTVSQNKLGLVTASRWIQMTIVLGIGELLVGFFASTIPLQWDLLFRASCCLLVTSLIVVDERSTVSSPVRA